MLKYWTLYDSLFYSSYTIPKLKSWHESGKNDLKKFIARIGVPLEDAKQKYEFLNATHKETLKEKISSYNETFDFDDILVTTFNLCIDNKHSYNSIDFFNVISSVLNSYKNFNDITLKLDRDDEDLFHSNKEDNFWCVYHKILER
jgi:cell division control protein 45